MIGRDFQIESAASRPFIVHWVSKCCMILSLFILAASLVTASSAIRQMRAKSAVYAIKPAGGYFEINGFSSSDQAQAQSAQANQEKGLNPSPVVNRKAR